MRPERPSWRVFIVFIGKGSKRTWKKNGFSGSIRAGIVVRKNALNRLISAFDSYAGGRDSGIKSYPGLFDAPPGIPNTSPGPCDVFLSSPKAFPGVSEAFPGPIWAFLAGPVGALHVPAQPAAGLTFTE